MRKIKGVNYFIFVSTMGLILYYYIPFFNIFSVPSKVGIGTFLILLFYLGVMVDSREIAIRTFLTTFLVLLFVLVDYYSQWANSGIGFLAKNYYSFLFWFPFIQMTYFTKKRNMAFSRMIVYVSVMTLAFTSITTIIGLNVYPLASRHLAGEYQSIVYHRMNIGGYGFIYSLVFCIPLMVYAYKNSRRNQKANILAITAIFLFTIIRSQYTIAIIFSLLLAVLFFINVNKAKRLVAVIFSIMIWVNIYNEKIGLYIINLSNSIAKYGLTTLQYRLNEVGLSLYNPGFAGGAATRADLYMMSINSFISNPVLGVWGSSSGNHRIGGHSAMLDTVGSSGILGAALISIIIIIFINRVKGFLTGYNLMNYVSITAMAILLFAFINTIFSSHQISMLLFVVSYNFYFVEYSKKKVVN